MQTNLKKVGFKLIGILLFVASGLITFLYMTSNVVGMIACFIAGIQALGIESAKSFFSYVFITTNSHNFGKKACFGVLAVLAFIISIIATTGWGISMGYKMQDLLLKKSDQYKNAQNFLTTQNKLFETTQKQIEDLKAQRDTQIKGMEKTRDAWGKNYKTQKSLEQEKINKATTKFNGDIAAKEQALDNIAKSLNQTTGESLKAEGFGGLYIQLAKYINDSRTETVEVKPVLPDDVNFWINFCISVCLEFFGIGFIYLSMKEDSHSHSHYSPTLSHGHSVGFKPTITTAYSMPENVTTVRKIGFQCEPKTFVPQSKPEKEYGVNIEKPKEVPQRFEPQSVDNKVLGKYLDYIYNNVDDDGAIPGYQKTGKDLELSSDAVRKLKNHCENLSILKSDPLTRKTYISKPKNALTL